MFAPAEASPDAEASDDAPRERGKVLILGDDDEFEELEGAAPEPAPEGAG